AGGGRNASPDTEVDNDASARPGLAPPRPGRIRRLSRRRGVVNRPMKIRFLGTGTSVGVPAIGCRCAVCLSSDPRNRRTRSSIAVEYDGMRLVIDTGPDFRQQMLDAGIDHLDAVLYTHSHADHV